jgi:hypothetical protein
VTTTSTIQSITNHRTPAIRHTTPNNPSAASPNSGCGVRDCRQHHVPARNANTAGTRPSSLALPRIRFKPIGNATNTNKNTASDPRSPCDFPAVQGLCTYPTPRNSQSATRPFQGQASRTRDATGRIVGDGDQRLWKLASLKPKADAKVTEILIASERPMTVDEIVQAVGGLFSPWKVRNTLKKKSTGAKAIFAVNDGRYSMKAVA